MQPVQAVEIQALAFLVGDLSKARRSVEGSLKIPV